MDSRWERGAELGYLWPLNAASSATIRFLPPPPPPPHVTDGTPPFSFYLCCSGAFWEMWFCVHLLGTLLTVTADPADHIGQLINFSLTVRWPINKEFYITIVHKGLYNMIHKIYIKSNIRYNTFRNITKLGIIWKSFGQITMLQFKYIHSFFHCFHKFLIGHRLFYCYVVFSSIFFPWLQGAAVTFAVSCEPLHSERAAAHWLTATLAMRQADRCWLNKCTQPDLQKKEKINKE